MLSCVAILRAVLPDELHRGLLRSTPREVPRPPADISDPDRARLGGGFMRREALSRDDARARSAQRAGDRAVGPTTLLQHRQPGRSGGA